MTLRARLVGLSATLLTLALTAGVPTLLLALAENPLPDSLPTLAAIRTALTTPDDGTLLLSVITWAAWAGWAVLTVAVLLEVAARARGIRTPHLPGLALPQGAAAQLVGAATLLFLVAPPSIATTNAAPAQPVPALTAPLSPLVAAPGWTPAGASADAGTAPPAAESTAADETYTVRRGDSLSRIAAEHLGDGNRWPELVDLNPALADDPDLIYAGNVIALPPAAHLSGASAEGRTYVVQAGDTLSSIAERELGDAKLYPLIYQANRGFPQPAGAFLRDPDVIDIGWRLTIPTPAKDAPRTGTGIAPAEDIAPPLDTSAPPMDTGAPPVDNHAAIPPPPAPSNPAPRPAPQADQQTSQGVNGAVTPRQFDRSAPEHVTSTSRGQAPAAVDTTEKDTGETVETEPDWLVLGLTGAGALLAGSLLTNLRRRRRAGMRHRRPGRTLAAPDPVLAPIEKTLTTVGTTTAVTVDRVDKVLRRLAAGQGERQVPMPSLAAVQLTEPTITLVLSEPAELSPPWQGSAEGRRWSIGADTTLDEVGPDMEDQPPPWPLLATIGMSDDDARWLINLEGRHIAVTGDHTYGLDLARYLAAEAATNPWSTSVLLDLVGVAPELAGLDPDRIHAHTNTGDGDDPIGSALVDAIAAVDRTRDTGRDTVTARVSLDEPDAWPARLLLVDADTHTDSLEPLLALLHAHPDATGTSVIVTAATTSQPRATAVHVSAHGRVTVPDLGLDLIATGLTLDEAHGCAALLAHAEDPLDAPVPDSTDGAAAWAGFADQAGALRAEHTLPRHAPGHASDGDPEPSETENDEAAASSLLPGPDGRYLTVGSTTAHDLSVLAPRVPDTVRRDVQDADPCLDDDVAMWFRADSALPKLALLGPVKVTARGTTPTKRRPYLAELLAFIALTPNGAITAEICEAFAITGSRARDHLTTLRRWLGTNPRTGTPHIPDARKAPGSLTRGTTVYQVQDLLIDLDLFRRLRTRAQARGADGITDLTTALRLVTGRPFDYPIEREAAGGWSWLISGDRHDEHARVAAVDVAHIVTTRALADGDLPTARRAAETALLAAPYEEIPRLDLAAVAAAEGHQQEAQRIIRDEVANRTDDDGAPPEVPDRTAQILRQRHPWATTRAS